MSSKLQKRLSRDPGSAHCHFLSICIQVQVSRVRSLTVDNNSWYTLRHQYASLDYPSIQKDKLLVTKWCNAMKLRLRCRQGRSSLCYRVKTSGSCLHRGLDRIPLLVDRKLRVECRLLLKGLWVRGWSMKTFGLEDLKRGSWRREITYRSGHWVVDV